MNQYEGIILNIPVKLPGGKNCYVIAGELCPFLNAEDAPKGYCTYLRKQVLDQWKKLPECPTLVEWYVAWGYRDDAAKD